MKNLQFLVLKRGFIFIILFVFIVQAETLKVIVTGFKNNNGEAQISLYNKDGTIPDKNTNQFYKTKRVIIYNKKAQTIFKNLPKGRYAVSVYHDENNNHKLDKGFMLPIEGVGLSNFNSMNLFNIPNFKKASFLLNKDKKIQINIIYL